jgi:hypothetical protein
MGKPNIDLNDDEVKARLGSYSDARVTDELYDFGSMLLHDAVERMGKLDSKVASVAAYCGALIMVLVATHNLWSKLPHSQICLISGAAVLIALAAASAVASMSLRATEWFSQDEWLKTECLSSIDRIRRYHVFTMWGIVKSHHAAYRRKILMVYLTQFLLAGAGVILLVALL